MVLEVRSIGVDEADRCGVDITHPGTDTDPAQNLLIHGEKERVVVLHLLWGSKVGV